MTSVTGSFPQLNVRVTVWNLSRYFFKTDAKVLSEVPDHPERMPERKAHWPTGTPSLVTIAIKPDLAAQIHVECPCLYVCFIACVWVREAARNGERNMNLCFGSPVGNTVIYSL